MRLLILKHIIQLLDNNQYAKIRSKHVPLTAFLKTKMENIQCPS